MKKGFDKRGDDSRVIDIPIWQSDTPMECGCCGEKYPARVIALRDLDLGADICPGCGLFIFRMEVDGMKFNGEGLSL